MSELWTDHVSFSQLTTAEECPYAYFLLKAAGVTPVENAFAQAGSLVHRLLAAWAKGELSREELPSAWIQRFPAEMTAAFPRYLEARNYKAKLFDAVLTYLEGFEGFPGYEIVAAEQEFTSSIGGERFVGIIDLILRSKETGGFVLLDHKSASLSSFRKSRDMMYRQLYLYAKYCADTYGSFPEKLVFNLFKEHTTDERPFSPEEYMEAWLWAETVLAEMKAKELPDWLETRPELFRCTNLCSCRAECCFGRAENHKRKENANGVVTAA